MRSNRRAKPNPKKRPARRGKRVNNGSVDKKTPTTTKKAVGGRARRGGLGGQKQRRPLGKTSTRGSKVSSGTTPKVKTVKKSTRKRNLGSLSNTSDLQKKRVLTDSLQENSIKKLESDAKENTEVQKPVEEASKQQEIAKKQNLKIEAETIKIAKMSTLAPKQRLNLTESSSWTSTILPKDLIYGQTFPLHAYSEESNFLVLANHRKLLLLTRTENSFKLAAEPKNFEKNFWEVEKSSNFNYLDPQFRTAYELSIDGRTHSVYLWLHCMAVFQFLIKTKNQPNPGQFRYEIELKGHRLDPAPLNYLKLKRLKGKEYNMFRFSLSRQFLYRGLPRPPFYFYHELSSIFELKLKAFCSDTKAMFKKANSKFRQIFKFSKNGFAEGVRAVIALDSQTYLKVFRGKKREKRFEILRFSGLTKKVILRRKCSQQGVNSDSIKLALDRYLRKRTNEGFEALVDPKNDKILLTTGRSVLALENVFYRSKGPGGPSSRSSAWSVRLQSLKFVQNYNPRVVDLGQVYGVLRTKNASTANQQHGFITYLEKTKLTQIGFSKLENFWGKKNYPANTQIVATDYFGCLGEASHAQKTPESGSSNKFLVVVEFGKLRSIDITSALKQCEGHIRTKSKGRNSRRGNNSRSGKRGKLDFGGVNYCFQLSFGVIYARGNTQSLKYWAPVAGVKQGVEGVLLASIHSPGTQHRFNTLKSSSNLQIFISKGSEITEQKFLFCGGKSLKKLKFVRMLRIEGSSAHFHIIFKPPMFQVITLANDYKTCILMNYGIAESGSELYMKVEPVQTTLFQLFEGPVVSKYPSNNEAYAGDDGGGRKYVDFDELRDDDILEKQVARQRELANFCRNWLNGVTGLATKSVVLEAWKRYQESLGADTSGQRPLGVGGRFPAGYLIEKISGKRSKKIVEFSLRERKSGLDFRQGIDFAEWFVRPVLPECKKSFENYMGSKNNIYLGEGYLICGNTFLSNIRLLVIISIPEIGLEHPKSQYGVYEIIGLEKMILSLRQEKQVILVRGNGVEAWMFLKDFLEELQAKLARIGAGAKNQ